MEVLEAVDQDESAAMESRRMLDKMNMVVVVGVNRGEWAGEESMLNK